MTKIAIITDTHFGVRNDISHFLESQNKFFDTTFFPKIDELKIDTLLHLGDIFDRRKYINYYTLKQSKTFFFDKLRERNITMYVVIGNHDTYFRNTNEINSISLLLTEYPNIKILYEPQTIQIKETLFCNIPWICEDNKDKCWEEIKNTKAEVCIGHFDIQGFEMHTGAPSKDGIPKDKFMKFDLLMSGHFHHRSQHDNITYLGAPYEMTWSDYNDKKGFHIFDTATRKLEFIQNPNTMFLKVEYDESYFAENPPNFEDYRNKYIKVIITNRKNLLKFDTFIKNLHNHNPYDVKILETFVDFSSANVSDEINVEDTTSILNGYVDTITTSIEKNKLKLYLNSLHAEAIANETIVKE